MTDADGRYQLRGMPSGEYTLTAWHAQSREKTDDKAQTVARHRRPMSSRTSSSRSATSAAVRPSTEPGRIHEALGA